MTEEVTVDRALAREGARNLLQGCVGLRSGQSLLLVTEDPALNFYEAAVSELVAGEARTLGGRVTVHQAPRITHSSEVPADLTRALKLFDHCVFFSRIGDQIRFDEIGGTANRFMSYVLDLDLMARPFARMPHGLMRALLNLMEECLSSADRWHLTCPLGSDAEGPIEDFWGSENSTDFSLGLFPELIFRPISCRGMRGKIALGRQLMATSNHLYEPSELDLEGPVQAIISDGRIVGIEGDAPTVSAVEAHYRYVGDLLKLDPWVVHSWHAGIHPQTYYGRPAAEDPERWGTVAFGSPRYAHFHTCGDYAPGEIAWSLFDCSIDLDGEPIYDQGELVFLQSEEAQALLRDYPSWRDGFAACREIGID